MLYHLRRKDKEIKELDKIKKILKETKYVTIALVKDGEPYLVPLSHGYDEKENCIYFHSASVGKKLDYMKACPYIWSIAIQDHRYHVGECSHLYASVMFKGKIEFINNLETKHHVFRTMIAQLEPDPKSIMNDMVNSTGIPTTIVGKINIEYMTGKKSTEIEI
jgi:nitroimidazol reductase NimA-like FMN-containing flavoprotein (pyridoxamine 5'-phosphate oxidase superfamily)